MSNALTETRGWTLDALRERVVRYDALVPCRNAFIDTRNPGSEEKENFTIIGPGVSENPEQHVHIAEPHGFNIGAARQPPHCVNSQHSHDTAEVFVVHSGRWTFNFGEHGDDNRIEAGPGTVASIPTHLFRGFSNVGEDTGFLWVALGGDDPGRVLWAPYVFDMASKFGLVLMEDGSLVDTARGQATPEGARVMPRTSPEQVAALARPDRDELEACIIPPQAIDAQPLGMLTGDGVDERLLIGRGGPLSWPHGFTLTRATFVPGARVAPHTHDGREVWFVHKGRLSCEVENGALALGAGDTFTAPPGLVRGWRAEEGTVAFVVRGGDTLPELGRARA
jgi:quercetin dioxygenase-like cupin family protein